MSSPRAVIKVKRRIKVATLLDTEVDINVIITKIADAVNLPILEITPLEAETFTGYNTQLLRIYRKVNIQIGAICNSINIFII
jgi:hypothetical protein